MCNVTAKLRGRLIAFGLVPLSAHVRRCCTPAISIAHASLHYSTLDPRPSTLDLRPSPSRRSCSSISRNRLVRCQCHVATLDSTVTYQTSRSCHPHRFGRSSTSVRFISYASASLEYTTGGIRRDGDGDGDGDGGPSELGGRDHLVPRPSPFQFRLLGQG